MSGAGAGGGRNVRLAAIAGRLRAQGQDHDAILAHLRGCPERAGLPESECRSIAKSISGKPAGVPRGQWAQRQFRDSLEEWCVRRGLAESAARAFGAFAKGREVWAPERDGKGVVVNHARRRGDNAPFSHGGKGSCEKGKPRGLAMTWPLSGEGPVLVVEGLPDGVAARGVLCDLDVVVKPAAKLSPHCEAWLQWVCAGREVILAPDPNEVGLAGAETTAAALVMAGARVRFVAPLPGLDLDKRLQRVAEHERTDHLRGLIEGALAWRPGTWTTASELKQDAISVANDTKSEVPFVSVAGDDGRPVVRLSTDEAAVADEALGHLGAREGSLVFKRGGVLVTLDPGDAIDGPRVVPMEAPMVRDALSRAMCFEDEKGRAARPARWLAEAIVSRATLPAIKRLVSVVEAPTLLPDGRVVEAEGHDAGSGLFLVRRGNFPAIPEAPSKDEARAAAGRLLDVVGDFPLADETAKSVWLAALLSMVGREAIDGPVPMFGFDANVRGAGKTLVASLAALVATGRMPAMASVPESDAEMRKRITALAVEGARVALLDNAIEPVGGESLDACLTSTTWKDRVLGLSMMTAGLPMRIVWLATGNGLAFRGDMVRRALVCRLDSPLENPEARTGFAIPDVVAHVGRHRGALYVDAMTILRGYCAAGRPEVEVRPMGSFEAWASLVARAIVWCGLPDPIASRTVLAESGDADRDLLVALFVELDRQDPDGRGVLAAALVQSDSRPWCDAMDAALSGKPNAKTLAMKMAKLARRVVGGRRLGKRICQGAALWFVERAR